MTRADPGAQRVQAWRQAQQEGTSVDEIHESAYPDVVEGTSPPSTDRSLQSANAGSSSPVSSGNRNYDEQPAAEVVNLPAVAPQRLPIDHDAVLSGDDADTGAARDTNSTSLLTAVPQDDHFYQGPSHWGPNDYRLVSANRYPAFHDAVACERGGSSTAVQGPASLETGMVCTLEGVRGDPEDPDTVAVFKIASVLKGCADHGQEDDVLNRDDSAALYDSLTISELNTKYSGRYVAQRTNADGFLAANACPLLGTWEYVCGSGKRKYCIAASETGAVEYREQPNSIRLHHRTDVDYIAQTRGDELSQPPFLADWGGATADGVAIFFALQSDGSLRSSYCKLGGSPYETTATRVALGNARVMPEFSGEKRHYTGVPNVPGVCGLRNIGNTCFMNSAIQCASACKELTEYFVSGKYRMDLNRKNPVGAHGELADHYSELMKAMWSGDWCSVNPSPLKKIIDNYQPRFSGYSQHDSQELLSYLLDGLHEDTNKIKAKPYFEEKEEEDRLPEVEKERLAWTRHKQRNDSVVADLFEGQLKSVLKCNVCEHQGTKYEPMTSITLPVQVDSALFRMYKILFCPSDTSKPIEKYYYKHRVTEDLKQAVRYYVQAAHPSITNTQCLHVEEGRTASAAPAGGYYSQGYSSMSSRNDATTDASLPSVTVFETHFENPRVGGFRRAAHPVPHGTSQPAEAAGGDDARAKKRKTDPGLDDARPASPQLGDPISILKGLVYRSAADVPYFTLLFSTCPAGARMSTYATPETTPLHAVLAPLDATKQEVYAEALRVSDASREKRPVFTLLRKNNMKDAIGPDSTGTLLTPEQQQFHKAKLGEALAEEQKKFDGRIKEEIEKLEKKAEKAAAAAAAPAAASDLPSPTSSSSSVVSAASSAAAVSHLRHRPKLATYLAPVVYHVILNETLAYPEAEGAAPSDAAPGASEEGCDATMQKEEESPVAAAPAAPTPVPYPVPLASRGVVAPAGDAALAQELRQWAEDSARTQRTVEQCRDTYTEQEQLDESNPWYCPKCQDHVRAFKMISIYRPPKYLVVHFNRFSYHASASYGRYYGGVRKKVETNIIYGDTFDLQPSIDPQSPFYTTEPVKYSLYGVTCHMGSAIGGHYIAYTKVGREWKLCNDSTVSSSTLKEATNSSAYILFYERAEDVPEVCKRSPQQEPLR